jgi:hypothetical protein
VLLICHHPFGNFKPGDTVEVPEGAFDTAYFERAEEPAPEPASEKGKK